jgi:hypothetical protein
MIGAGALAILVIGLAVRLWGIGAEPLWLDEAYSALCRRSRLRVPVADRAALRDASAFLLFGAAAVDPGVRQRAARIARAGHRRGDRHAVRDRARRAGGGAAAGMGYVPAQAGDFRRLRIGLGRDSAGRYGAAGAALSADDPRLCRRDRRAAAAGAYRIDSQSRLRRIPPAARGDAVAPQYGAAFRRRADVRARHRRRESAIRPARRDPADRGPCGGGAGLSAGAHDPAGPGIGLGRVHMAPIRSGGARHPLAVALRRAGLAASRGVSAGWACRRGVPAIVTRASSGRDAISCWRASPSSCRSCSR